MSVKISNNYSWALIGHSLFSEMHPTMNEAGRAEVI